MARVAPTFLYAENFIKWLESLANWLEDRELMVDEGRISQWVMLDFYYILLWDSSKFIMLELKYQSNLRCLPLIDWKVVQCYQGYTIGHDALLTETWFNVTTVHNGLSFWGVVRDHGLTTDPCKLTQFYAPTMNVCFDTCACFRSLRS